MVFFLVFIYLFIGTTHYFRFLLILLAVASYLNESYEVLHATSVTYLKVELIFTYYFLIVL